MNLLSIILAAGKGTRMNSDIPKVLHPIAGKSMIQYIFDTVTELNSEIICVVGYKAEKVRDSVDNNKVRFVKQKEQLGTGHAVLQAKKYINKHEGPVLVLYGDTPLLSEKTLTKMLKYHDTNNTGVSVLTASINNPTGYGRIVRDKNDFIKKIVEETDASSDEKTIKEINTGVYCFDSKLLDEALENLECDNVQGEYYLTDAISYINEKDKKVIPVSVDNDKEIIGVNDRLDLAEAEKYHRRSINQTHMKNGVTIIDPETTYIDSEVEIKKDSVIYPFTYIEGQSKIGSHTVIGPHSRIVDSNLGENIELKANSNIWHSIIKDNCIIGPFAYIRPGCEIEKGVKVGDFVELKKAKIDEATKVPHLSYVGDAEIGKKTNVGAGTIFANYDGENKHKIKVGNSCFIGSNSTLIAPVNIGDRAKTGAGAVVTKDVENDTTVIGVPARVYNNSKEEK